MLAISVKILLKVSVALKQVYRL